MVLETKPHTACSKEGVHLLDQVLLCTYLNREQKDLTNKQA